MADEEIDWFTVKADIQIAEPVIDEETGEYINLGFRSAERLRDALDVALKMREPRACEVLPLR